MDVGVCNALFPHGFAPSICCFMGEFSSSEKPMLSERGGPLLGVLLDPPPPPPIVEGARSCLKERMLGVRCLCIGEASADNKNTEEVCQHLTSHGR
eukprot:2236171-Rhodomonas_salina.1